MSRTEKDLAGDSQDEDSGHDSADSLAGPALVDDRERIVHLETAVAWIKEEMASLRRYDKEILQDLWKVRTGIHDIREIHRKQLSAEMSYLDTSTSTAMEGQRVQSEDPPESPLSPLSPISPPPGISRLSVSAFNLKEVSPAEKSDDAILQSFFGTDSMEKVNSMMQQPSEPEIGKKAGKKSQSTDRLISVGLPPLPEKRRPKVNPISRSPKYSRFHTSTPDMSSLRRSNQPVSDVCSEMQKLRMKLRETANQTVAEIEERFSPKFNRLTLGPVIDLPSDDNSSIGDHAHQGSLDSFSNSPLIDSARHSRQRSLPLSVVAQAKQSPLNVTTTPSSPKSPPSSVQHRHSNSDSRNPGDRSPTPPNQPQHGRQASLGSSNLSGLVTNRYQNQPYEVPANSHRQQQQPPFSAGYRTPNAATAGLQKTPPPPMTRQYSPSPHLNVKAGGVQGSVQANYVYGNQRSNGVARGQQQNSLSPSYGDRMYSSNPNLLSGDSTHYSTTVIKKRRSSGNKNGTSQSSLEPAAAQLPNSHGTMYDKQEQHSPSGYLQPTLHSKQSEPSHSSYHPHSTGQTHSIGPQYSHNELSRQNHSQRGIGASSNAQQELQKIKPYMSTGELKASMKTFQYVPFAQQRSAVVHGHGYTDAENTWL